MLDKLLFKNQEKKQLFIAIVGSVLGITFLICSIHYLIKVSDFGKGSEILGTNTLIVQKKVSNSSTLGLTKNVFSLEEIAKFKQLPFIEVAKPVISNNFEIYFETNDPLVPKFSSIVFVQTLDKSFIDVKTNDWYWKDEKDCIPIIMPRDFLVMLNTFMSASGIPQISDELAKDIKFKISLRSPDRTKRVELAARIVGFTNEVASMLVPASFMDYGNQNFSDGAEQKITQLMIAGKESEFGSLELLLNEKGLESNKSQMLIGRLKSIVSTLFLVIMGISIIAVFTSGLVLIQYLQLLISKNAYEVRTLMRIGYHPKALIHKILKYFVRIFGVIAGIGLLLFIILKYFLDKLFETGGLFIDKTLTFESILALLIAYLLFVFTSYKTAKKGVLNEF